MDALLAENRRRMVALLSTVAVKDGAHASILPDVTLLRAARTTLPVPVLYTPCIVVVARGRKRFHLPDRMLDYDPGRYLVVTVPVPADCETLVGDDGPFLAMAVRIDVDVVSDLLIRLDEPAAPAARAGASLAAPMDASVSSASLRLAEALACPADARALGAERVRELLYRVLSGPAGGALRSLVVGSEARTQVHRILERLHRNYAAPFEVAALARAAGMSASALHFHFRAVTGTSPVQYLKMLRLHRARMLMVQSSLQAAEAAVQVGYESASQFSREFKRLFGAPPAEEAERVRKAFGFADSVSAAS